MKNLLVKLYLLLALYGGYFGVAYADCQNSFDRGNHKLHIMAPYGVLDNYGGASSLSVSMTCLDGTNVFHEHHTHLMHTGFTMDAVFSYTAEPHECGKHHCAEDYNVELNGKSISGIKSIPYMQTGGDIYILLKPSSNNVSATTIADWSYVPKP